MRRFALGVFFLCGAFALWAGLARSQSDPWWHPINPYGQSEGVTYGYALPASTNVGAPSDGLLAVRLIDPLDGALDNRPRFNIYDDSVNDWREFLYQRSLMATGEGGAWSAVAPTVPALDGGDTWYGFAINPTNSTAHSGVGNIVSMLGIGGITPHASATEWAIGIGDGYDQDIRIDGDARITGVDSITFFSDGVNSFEIDNDGIFPRSVTFATLPAAANGSIIWCSDCDQGSSPCASTPGPGAFALRENGAWECSAGAGGGVTVGTAYTIPKWNAVPDDLIDTYLTELAVPAAGASGDILTQAYTLNAMDGSDVVRGLFIDPTNADHTGASNYLYGLDINGITGDADATEAAINIQGAATSWDYGLYVGQDTQAYGGFGAASIYLGSTGTFPARIMWAPATGALFMGDASSYVRFNIQSVGSQNYRYNLQGYAGDEGGDAAMRNVVVTMDTVAMNSANDTREALAIDAGDANHSNGAMYGARVYDITQDAQALEYGVAVEAGWDVALYSAGVAHASLAAAPNGSMVFCTDCDPASTPCTTGGASTGAFAFRVNGQWDCPW